MALSIKDPEADALARELAAETGETITEAILKALRERLARQRRKAQAPARLEKLRAIRKSMQDLKTIDERSDEQILGYDDRGIPS
jgi:antitoxin VapB